MKTVTVQRPHVLGRFLDRLVPSRGVADGCTTLGSGTVRVCGIPVAERVVSLYDGIPPRVAERRVCRALTELSRLGARELVTSDGFAYDAAISAAGLSKPCTEPFRRALLAPMARRATAELLRTTPRVAAAVYARRTSRELNGVVSALLELLPYVAVSLDTGAEAYADHVYATCGAVLDITESAARSAMLHVVLDLPQRGFAPTAGSTVITCRDVPAGCTVYRGARLRVSDRSAVSEAAGGAIGLRGYSPLQSVAALYSLGVLNVEQIEVFTLVHDNVLDFL